jgi:hypothetical protein
MSTLLKFGRDVQGYNAFAPPFSADKYAVTLTGGAAQQITIPGTYTNWIVSFSYQPGTNVWVARNGTAAVPTGTVGTTNSEQNPGQRTIQAGDTLSFITDNTTADFGIILYAIS